MEYVVKHRSFLQAIACEVRLSLAVPSTDTASTKNANGLRLILAMPTFHIVMVMPNAKLTDDEERAKDARLGTGT